MIREEGRRCVVNVATGGYVRGQKRLAARCDYAKFMSWSNEMPSGSPSHAEKPYAFKAHALAAAAAEGHTSLLWADASIVPVRSLSFIFSLIESQGYWISRNGWFNGEWTADAAYPDLGISREENWTIPHVVATSFGVDLRHPTGLAIYQDYLQLAGTNAFCGPWWNSAHPDNGNKPKTRTWECGDAKVLGHRHDQTALSVIAHRNGCVLTDPPKWFAYRTGETVETVLVADGSF